MSEEKDYNRWIVVIGAVLIQLALGTIYCWGNLTSYITPYLNDNSSNTIESTQTLYIFALGLLSFAIVMIFSGQLQQKIGPMKVGLIGGIIVSVAVLLSSFITNFIGMLLSYGILFGIGIGFAYVCPIACAAKWFPDKKGLINGIAVAGFGAGAFIFNLIATGYINPEGVEDVTAIQFERVPALLQILAVIYAIMIIGGSLTLKNPPEGYIPEGWNPPVQTDEEEQKEIHQEISRDKAIKLPQFWILWGMFVLTAASGLFTVGYYKDFGELAVWGSDKYLSFVGSLAALFNGLGRIVWGKLSDVFGYRKMLFSMATIQGILMLTFALTTVNKYVFLIWVCSIYFCFGGNFSLYPTATTDLFGAKNLGPNYGLIFTAYGVAGVSGALLAKPLGNAFGVWGLFVSMGLFSLGAIFLNKMLKPSKSE